MVTRKTRKQPDLELRAYQQAQDYLALDTDDPAVFHVQKIYGPEAGRHYREIKTTMKLCLTNDDGTVIDIYEEVERQEPNAVMGMRDIQEWLARALSQPEAEPNAHRGDYEWEDED